MNRRQWRHIKDYSEHAIGSLAGGLILPKEKMAPVSKKRSRQPPSYLPVSKRPNVFTAPRRSAKKTVASSKEKSITGYTNGLGLGAKKTYRKKSVSVRKPKDVRVSKVFKKKVEKAMAAGQIFGSVRSLTATNILVAATVNAQNVVYLSPTTGSVYGMDWLWTTDQFLHWASVLWNGKAAAPPTATTQAFGSGGVRNATNFNLLNLDCTIKSCSMEYKFKNHAQNACKLTIHQLKSKNVTAMYPGSNVSTGYNFVTNASQGRPGTCSIPETDWNEAINDEIVSKTQLNTSLDRTWIGLEPGMCKDFKARYTIETTYITLEPGQTQNYFVRGPSQLHLDYSKFVNDDMAMNIQKFSRGFIVTLEWLPAITYTATTTATGVFGRSGPLTNTSVPPAVTSAYAGVSCEMEYHLTMSVPQGADGNTDKTSRKRVDVQAFPTPLSVPCYRNSENPDDFLSGAFA